MGGFYGIAEWRAAQDVLGFANPYKVCEIRAAGGELGDLNSTALTGKMVLKVLGEGLLIQLLALAGLSYFFIVRLHEPNFKPTAR
jgi:hypothetical protein